MPRGRRGRRPARGDSDRSPGLRDFQAGNDPGGLGLFRRGDYLDLAFGATPTSAGPFEHAGVADHQRPGQGVQPRIGPAGGDHLGADARRRPPSSSRPGGRFTLWDRCDQRQTQPALDCTRRCFARLRTCRGTRCIVNLAGRPASDQLSRNPLNDSDAPSGYEHCLRNRPVPHRVQFQASGMTIAERLAPVGAA